MERTRIERGPINGSTAQNAAADGGLNSDPPHTMVPSAQADDLDRLLARAPLYNDWDEV